jgi:hypothetical protein
MRSAILASVILIAGGCAGSPVSGEEHRELVLQYVGHDVGTVGPFSTKEKRELDVLSEKDRKEAVEMLARGAQAFLVIEPSASVPNRIIVLSGKQVVGDFPAPKKDEPNIPTEPTRSPAHQ